jgi:hypothetical protein
MKTRTFQVPADSMVEFAGIIEEHDLVNEVTGVNEDEEVLIDVHYDKEDKEAIFELMMLLDPEDEDEDND